MKFGIWGILFIFCGNFEFWDKTLFWSNVFILGLFLFWGKFGIMGPRQPILRQAWVRNTSVALTHEGLRGQGGINMRDP